MPDREKTIKAIETHISTDDFVGCDDCTYENDGWCMTRVLSDALALLKKQEDSCWINVKDKLPPRNTNVLWWCVLRDRCMGHVRIGFYEGVTNHDIPEVSCCAPNCIPLYWMPMPNAPTEAAIHASGNYCCTDEERKEGR